VYLAWDGDWSAWFGSDVALALYAMGAVLIPVLLVTIARWTRAGYALAEAGERRLAPTAVVAVYLATIFIAAFGIAVTASLVIHALGAPLGVPVAAALSALALVPGGPACRLLGLLGLDGPPASVVRRVRPLRGVLPGAVPRGGAGGHRPRAGGPAPL
jgi:hypothetical protein